MTNNPCLLLPAVLGWLHGHPSYRCLRHTHYPLILWNSAALSCFSLPCCERNTHSFPTAQKKTLIFQVLLAMLCAPWVPTPSSSFSTLTNITLPSLLELLILKCFEPPYNQLFTFVHRAFWETVFLSSEPDSLTKRLLEPQAG